MGIKGFSKTFEPTITTLAKLKNKKAAIDASVMMYQSALGMKSINGLTDSEGNPTLHINVIHSRVLKFISYKIPQIWVFDYHEKGYSCPDKQCELKKRQEKKKKALDKIKTIEEELFSDSDEEEKKDDETKKCGEKKKDEKNKLEKVAFSIDDKIVNDCKFILTSYNIPWIVAPKGFEAEYVCVKLCHMHMADFVYSTDVDALLYRAPILIRPVKIKSKRVLQEYNLSSILSKNKITQADLIKIGMILGSDHAPKTPRIGPKTVIKKYKDTTLTEEQKKGTAVFKKSMPRLNVNYIGITTEQLYKQIHELLAWLTTKNFNIKRVKKQINKAYPKFYYNLISYFFLKKLIISYLD